MNPCFDQSETTFPLATTKIQHPSQKRLKKARSNALHAVFQDVTAFIKWTGMPLAPREGKDKEVAIFFLKSNHCETYILLVRHPMSMSAVFAMALTFTMVFGLHGVHFGIRIFQPGFYIAITVMIELTHSP